MESTDATSFIRSLRIDQVKAIVDVLFLLRPEIEKLNIDTKLFVEFIKCVDNEYHLMKNNQVA